MLNSQTNMNLSRHKVLFRNRVVSTLINFFVNFFTKITKWIPSVRRQFSNLIVLKNIPYGSGNSWQLCDIYAKPNLENKMRSAVLYVHGGGFVILSKDTHWPMALKFAQENYVVFSINYRLAPKFQSPHALEDCALALIWLLENSEKYRIDKNKIILAGESAGGNLVSALALCCYKNKQSPWAQKLYNYTLNGMPWKPFAVLPACGLLQVSHPERYQKLTNSFYFARIQSVCNAYLGDNKEDNWASPLVEFEEDETFQRMCSPFFIAVGACDPIFQDSARLHQALLKRDVPCEFKIYKGGVHAFHVFIWTKLAKKCWEDSFDFLRKLE
jgi:acetyl esterase